MVLLVTAVQNVQFAVRKINAIVILTVYNLISCSSVWPRPIVLEHAVSLTTYTVSQKKLSRFIFVRTSSNFHQFR